MASRQQRPNSRRRRCKIQSDDDTDEYDDSDDADDIDDNYDDEGDSDDDVDVATTPKRRQHNGQR